MQRCKTAAERLFYVVQARQNSWSRSTLEQQIRARAYDSTVRAQHNFPATLPPAQLLAATLALKDEYTFGFLALANEHSEHELEQALLGNVRRFLVEMGGDFAFIGNQYRLALEDQEYFIDLLLFHRELQCLVAVELKITEFRPEYAGKMNFYLSLLNEQLKKPHEQPSIGIIICQSKQRTVVEFALRDVNKPIGVATYTLTDTLPAGLAPLLPQQRRAGAPPRCRRRPRCGGRAAGRATEYRTPPYEKAAVRPVAWPCAAGLRPKPGATPAVAGPPRWAAAAGKAGFRPQRIENNQRHGAAAGSIPAQTQG
ncbi:MAG: PDDEXK nuclease domain-containing protein [Hymenobacter sp.]